MTGANGKIGIPAAARFELPAPLVRLCADNLILDSGRDISMSQTGVGLVYC